jgi:hypothetical protein
MRRQKDESKSFLSREIDIPQQFKSHFTREFCIKHSIFFCRFHTQIGDGLIFLILKCQINPKFVLLMHLFVRIGENERVFNFLIQI